MAGREMDVHPARLPARRRPRTGRSFRRIRPGCPCFSRPRRRSAGIARCSPLFRCLPGSRCWPPRHRPPAGIVHHRAHRGVARRDEPGRARLIARTADRRAGNGGVDDGVLFPARHIARSAAAAGVPAGLAILIRPNLVPLAAPMGMAARATRPWRPVGSIAPRRRRLFRTGVGAASQQSRSSTSISRLGDDVGLRPPRGSGGLVASASQPRRYLSWFIETQTPLALAGLLALFSRCGDSGPTFRTGRSSPSRPRLALFWGFYCAYLEFDSWGYLRFLLPGCPSS